MGSGSFLHPAPMHVELWHQPEPKFGVKQQYLVCELMHGIRTRMTAITKRAHDILVSKRGEYFLVL